MTGRPKALVMGASGFVGSHVTRRLVESGDEVRVYLRKSSSTVAIDDLDVERCYGDLHDEEALREAMSDRDVVFYRVVDTRFYLRDPAPLFETNVNCLRPLSAALAAAARAPTTERPALTPLATTEAWWVPICRLPSPARPHHRSALRCGPARASPCGWHATARAIGSSAADFAEIRLIAR